MQLLKKEQLASPLRSLKVFSIRVAKPADREASSVDKRFSMRQCASSYAMVSAPYVTVQLAAEAGVPLSATTYYFKDIDDLLTDTFAQYVERSAAYMARLWANNEGLLREMVISGDGSPECRSQLADDIARLMADYVHRQLINRREHLMAEQAFRQEALLNPRLALLVRSHQQILCRALASFSRYWVRESRSRMPKC